jgi:hypothetical protein
VKGKVRKKYLSKIPVFNLYSKNVKVVYLQVGENYPCYMPGLVKWEPIDDEVESVYFMKNLLFFCLAELFLPNEANEVL